MTTKAAAKAEAQGQNIEFEYDGQTYSVPPTNEWDIEALEAFEEGKIISAVKSVLGEAQWAQFKAKRRTANDLNDLFSALDKAAGFSGN